MKEKLRTNDRESRQFVATHQAANDDSAGG